MPYMVAQIHLKQNLASWASLFFQNPESLRVMLSVDNEQKQNEPGALLSIEGF